MLNDTAGRRLGLRSVVLRLRSWLQAPWMSAGLLAPRPVPLRARVGARPGRRCRK